MLKKMIAASILLACAGPAMGGGAAQLTGAGTIPEARGRGVYTTLLARRIEDARAHGYQLVMIGTTPMS